MLSLAFRDPLARRGAGAIAGIALVALALRLAGASRAQISAAAADPQGYVTAAGADEFVLALATAIGWLLLGWMALGAMLVLGSAAPGWLGWLFHQLARLLLPATLRRFVSLALGVTLLSGTTVASASPAAPMASISVTLDWPTEVDFAGASAPDWPVPVESAAQPAPTAGPTESQPPGTHRSDGPDTYLVQPGDCLWDIAELGLAQAGLPVDVASVASAVDQWWLANLAQIDDPDLIFPGQVLRAPVP